MILATLGTSMVEVLVVTRCHAQYGAVHNHRDLCDTPLEQRGLVVMLPVVVVFRRL